MIYHIKESFSTTLLPRLNDRVIVESSSWSIPLGEYILIKCSCPNYVSLKENWPIGDKCGPHLFSTITHEDIGFIAWSGQRWFFNGQLIREEGVIKDFDIDLKTLNSAPNATHCVKCKTLLKEPWPRIKFCPNCEG